MATVGCGSWGRCPFRSDAGGPDAYRPPLGTGIDLAVVELGAAVVVGAAAAVAGVGVFLLLSDADWCWCLGGLCCCCSFWWLRRWCGRCCRSCRGGAAATISGGGCSWPVAWLGVVAATGAPFAGAATGRPTALPAALPALELLLPLPPSPCRIPNSPIDPNFFFVVGIILNRISTGARVAAAGSETTSGRRGWVSCGDWFYLLRVVVVGLSLLVWFLLFVVFVGDVCCC